MVFKKTVVTLAGILLLWNVIGKSVAAPQPKQITVHAELFYYDTLGYADYRMGEHETARCKHIDSNLIIEGTINSIESDSCRGSVKIIQRKKNYRGQDEILGGIAGYTKMYKILHEFQFTLEKDSILKLDLTDDVYLHIRYEI